MIGSNSLECHIFHIHSLLEPPLIEEANALKAIHLCKRVIERNQGSDPLVTRDRKPCVLSPCLHISYEPTLPDRATCDLHLDVTAPGYTPPEVTASSLRVRDTLCNFVDSTGLPYLSSKQYPKGALVLPPRGSRWGVGMNIDAPACQPRR